MLKLQDENDPNSFPPVEFDRFMECDRMAYLHANPNWPHMGKWWSKKRYGKCYIGGKMYPWHIEQERAIYNPAQEDDSSDPCDWSKLMDQYLYWRMRFSKQGYRIRHEIIEIMGHQEA